MEIYGWKEGDKEMKKKKENKLDKWFLLTWKKLLIIVGVWVLAVILHNLVYAIFFNYFQSTGGDEPFFLIIVAFVMPIYVLVCVIYSLIKKIKNKTLFEVKFIVGVLISIILGAVAILLIIKFNLINPEMGFMLTVIFIISTFIFYYLIKLLIPSKNI